MALIRHFPRETPPAFELKGRMIALSVLHVLTADLEALAEQLDARIASAPDLFENFPVLLDFEALPEETQLAFDIARLDRLLRERGFIPVGIRGACEVLAGIAAGVGLGTLAAGAAAAAPRQPPRESAEPRAANLLVREPVRSGQQIYAKGGDLIVLAAVSPGAEILADGNIHVYGTLRGRALAGVTGDTQARIFCRHLDAELVSIAGHYRVSEQIQDAERAQPVQIYLRDERLIIERM
ncbi:MAG TPA: septum site-determining protein MinC [Burkholderiales bacterium]